MQMYANSLEITRRFARQKKSTNGENIADADESNEWRHGREDLFILLKTTPIRTTSVDGAAVGVIWRVIYASSVSRFWWRNKAHRMHLQRNIFFNNSAALCLPKVESSPSRQMINFKLKFSKSGRKGEKDLSQSRSNWNWQTWIPRKIKTTTSEESNKTTHAANPISSLTDKGFSTDCLTKKLLTTQTVLVTFFECSRRRPNVRIPNN